MERFRSGTRLLAASFSYSRQFVVPLECISVDDGDEDGDGVRGSARTESAAGESAVRKRVRVSLTLRLICGHLLRSLLPFLTCIYETLLDLEIYIGMMGFCLYNNVGVCTRVAQQRG